MMLHEIRDYVVEKLSKQRYHLSFDMRIKLGGVGYENTTCIRMFMEDGMDNTGGPFFYNSTGIMHRVMDDLTRQQEDLTSYGYAHELYKQRS